MTAARSPISALLPLLVAVLALAAGTAARADWLVTRDGSRIETEGPWKVKGKLVVFTLPGGALSSLKAAEVDFEASERATAEARAATEDSPRDPAGGEAERRAPVLVLTDEDVTHVEPGSDDGDGENGGDGEDGGGKEGKGDEGKAAAGGLKLLSWEQVPDPATSGVQLFGSVRNEGENLATQITLTVTLYDEAGQILETRGATLGATSLSPRQSTSFRVAFPSISLFSNTEFSLRAQTYKTRGEDPKPPAGDTAQPATPAVDQPEV